MDDTLASVIIYMSIPPAVLSVCHACGFNGNSSSTVGCTVEIQHLFNMIRVKIEFNMNSLRSHI